MTKDSQNVKLLENQLDKSLKRHSDQQAVNRDLRAQIDVKRKEQKTQLRVNKNLLKDIAATIEQAKKLSQGSYSGQRVAEETNNQILALKAKHEAEKFNFESKIKDLQDKLKEKDDSELDRTRTKDLGATKKGGPIAAAEFSNPAALLKMRLQKWTTNNKEKKHLMDMYVRNVKIIEDAFEQIKEATGISSTEEIVTTFIKAEEQNNSLINYVNMLSSEIDMIVDQNMQIESEIRTHELQGDLSAKEKQAARERIASQIAEVSDSTQARDKQIKDIETQLVDIKNHSQSMVE